MHISPHNPLLALSLAICLAQAAASPAAAQSVNDFQLPPNPTPSPTQRVQGPVDDSGVVPVAPRPIPTATPTRTPVPSASPTATASPSPSETQPALPARSPTPRPAATAGPALPGAVAPPVMGQSSAASPPETAAPPTGNPAFDVSPLPAATTAQPPADTPVDAPAWPAWWWIAAAAGAVFVAAIVALLAWRRRRQQTAVPEIIRPAAAGAGNDADGDPLRHLKIEIEAVRLSRSLMAATLTYRLTISNRSRVAIRNVALEGDLTSAHGQAALAEQLAEDAAMLPVLHSLDHLGAGQSKSFTGDLRLELRHVRPIRQGQVPIYIPLVRLRALATRAEARAYTFVVGKAPAMAGARLQPFRLDTPPQTFNEIGARLLG